MAQIKKRGDLVKLGQEVSHVEQLGVRWARITRIEYCRRDMWNRSWFITVRLFEEEDTTYPTGKYLMVGVDYIRPYFQGANHDQSTDTNRGTG